LGLPVVQPTKLRTGEFAAWVKAREPPTDGTVGLADDADDLGRRGERVERGDCEGGGAEEEGSRGGTPD
jgi:hypothetical protein